jgi:hypothetical protein
VVSAEQAEQAGAGAVVYQLPEPTAVDELRLASAVAAAQDLGIEVSFSVGLHYGRRSALIMSPLSEQEGRAAGAMIVGASRAASHGASQPRNDDPNEVQGYRAAIYQRSYELISDFRDVPFAAHFAQYVNGMQWERERDELARALFVEATGIDEPAIEASLNGNWLVSIAEAMGIELSLDERIAWRERPAGEILADHTKLDYRRLREEAFATTEEGGKLAAAYKEVSGDTRFERYRDWRTEAKPVLPVSQFPVLEGFFEDRILAIGSRSNWSLVARDVGELALRSDSVAAQRALIEIINTRIPKSEHDSPDGPTEFGVKQELVRAVIKAYTRTGDRPRRDFIRDGLLEVFESYTTGAIATDVAKARAANPRFADFEGIYSGTRKVALELFRAFLTSSDTKLKQAAADAIGHFISISEGPDKSGPRFLITRDELKIALLDAVQTATKETDTAAVEDAAATLFESAVVGKHIARIVEFRREADQVRTDPEVLAAGRRMSQAPKPSEDAEAVNREVRAAYARLIAPANEALVLAHQSTNRLVRRLIEELAESGEITQPTGEHLAKQLVVGLQLGSEEPGEASYQIAASIGKIPDVPTAVKSALAARVSDAYKYASPEAADKLGGIALEMLTMFLGPSANIATVDRELRHGLGAVSYMFSEHGIDIFRAASPDVIEGITAYVDAVEDQAGRVRHMVLKGRSSEAEREQLHAIDGASREMGRIMQARQKALGGKVAAAGPEPAL